MASHMEPPFPQERTFPLPLETESQGIDGRFHPVKGLPALEKLGKSIHSLGKGILNKILHENHSGNELNIFGNFLFGLNSDQTLGDFSIFKENHGGDATDTIFLS